MSAKVRKPSTTAPRWLTGYQKLDAIGRVLGGESKASVARSLGVPNSTLRGWCKSKEKILRAVRLSHPDFDEYLLSRERRRPTVAPAPGTFTIVNEYIDLTQPPKNVPSVLESAGNRAELSRIAIELSRNRPAVIAPRPDFAPPATAGPSFFFPKDLRQQAERPTVDEPRCYWLRTQQPTVGPDGTTVMKPTVAFAGIVADENSSFWRHCKPLSQGHLLQLSSLQPVPVNLPLRIPDRRNDTDPTLRDATRHHLAQPTTTTDNEKDDALKHGEKFLQWLEGCSHPSVSLVQIRQFKGLLHTVKCQAEKDSPSPLNLYLEK